MYIYTYTGPSVPQMLRAPGLWVVVQLLDFGVRHGPVVAVRGSFQWLQCLCFSLPALKPLSTLMPDAP